MCLKTVSFLFCDVLQCKRDRQGRNVHEYQSDE